MYSRLLALAAVSALAACSPAAFRGWPDPPHKFADCSGAPNGLAACFERARALCPDGYQLAEQRSDPAINRHQIIVRCGPPLAVDEPAPPAPARVVRPAPAVPK
ncbi:MAG TPA: hypothetical protein VIF14_15280 [Alphaproteobacteria bacterium]|jgi:hypothetical protein